MPANIDPAFQREVAEVHRDLFAEHGELYGANVRWKVERALEVTDEECEESVAARHQYRIGCTRGARRLRPLVTAHDRDRGALAILAERELRLSVLRFTEPFNVLGWPALAAVRTAAENGLPHPSRSSPRPVRMRSFSAPASR